LTLISSYSTSAGIIFYIIPGVFKFKVRIFSDMNTLRGRTYNDYDGVMYELGYPNQELKVSLLSKLYQNISPKSLLKSSLIIPA